MSLSSDNRAANDAFEVYFAEKLWEMIPAVYRHEDGMQTHPTPHVLRSLVEVLASQAAILRRSHDRLWEDQFIELCDDWAVPYLADLVATRLLPLENKRGRRVDVAKTIYYRRRKGTLRVLEELISDVTGWEGKVVENFKKLARSRHALDPKPAPLAGRFSKTLPGGWADLRSPLASELTGSPFDEFFHTPDLRQHKGSTGRYNIPKLAFHLYRLQALEVEDATPFADPAHPERFTFDPSGRDIPLFNRRNRAEMDWDDWHSADEWELPAPIRCRLLGRVEHEITEAVILKLIARHGLSHAAAADLRKLRNWRFGSDAELRTALLSLDNALELASPAIFPHLLYYSGNAFLVRTDLAVPPGDIAAGNLENWALTFPTDKELIIDPERGRMLFRHAPDEGVNLTCHYGFSGSVGAGTFDRREVEECEPDDVISGGGEILFSRIPRDGVLQINDNKTYKPVNNRSGIVDTTLQAANQKRPFLCLQNSTNSWVLEAETANPQGGASLVLDGLWIGAAGVYEIILRGTYECVILRHCTLDPGDQKNKNLAGNLIFPLSLVVEGSVKKMVIESCITGPLLARNPGTVGELVIRDSIIQSITPDEAFFPLQPAIQFEQSKVEMKRVTVLGTMHVNQLFASETLITGSAVADDTQHGCFRFGAAPELSNASLPPRYEHFSIPAATNPEAWFTSTRFGDPGYGQLSEVVPAQIHRGAENGSEIGAFSSLANPIKFDSLRAKVEEYMPFGLTPIFIYET